MPNSHRPLSPHLQVYRPQLTSVLSILHRITGAGLAGGAGLLTWWLAAAATGDKAFALTQVFRHSLPGRFMLLCWLFAFLYHFLNGIRHLKWDFGYGLSLKSVYRTGWIAVGGSLLLTALIWQAAGGRP